MKLDHAQSKFPAQWPDGPMARWPDGPMARWPDGPMTRWPDGPMAQWPDGPMAQWPDGPMAQWPDDPMAQWPDGPMAQWPDGPMVAKYEVGVNLWEGLWMGGLHRRCATGLLKETSLISRQLTLLIHRRLMPHLP